MTPASKPGDGLFSLLSRAEEIMLGGFLLVMILLACVQILLRSLFSGGLTWADPLLRYLVLWSGLLGAARATSVGKHISMDIIGFLVPGSLQLWLRAATNLFSAVVAGFLTWAAWLFIRSEMQFGTTKLFSTPSWVWNVIFPIAFALISLRFLIASMTALTTIFSLQKNPGKPRP
ncbi:MAG: TRAP transporter small permease subunit [Desulfocapsaceae bacterium]|nr:TRAP transporter small permease subunit [Desulfocapsaceae bacterium]